MRPLLVTCPTMQACALTVNRTGGPLVCRPVLNPLSHTSQGNLYHTLTVILIHFVRHSVWINFLGITVHSFPCSASHQHISSLSRVSIVVKSSCEKYIRALTSILVLWNGDMEVLARNPKGMQDQWAWSIKLRRDIVSLTRFRISLHDNKNKTGWLSFIIAFLFSTDSATLMAWTKGRPLPQHSPIHLQIFALTSVADSRAEMSRFACHVYRKNVTSSTLVWFLVPTHNCLHPHYLKFLFLFWRCTNFQFIPVTNDKAITVSILRWIHLIRLQAPKIYLKISWLQE